MSGACRFIVDTYRKESDSFILRTHMNSLTSTVWT